MKELNCERRSERLLAEVGREGIVSDGGDPKGKKKKLTKERKKEYISPKETSSDIPQGSNGHKIRREFRELA